MLLHIDVKSKSPLYIQIYHQIKDKIHENELKTNEKLTSKRQLAELNQVSENTVMNAYNQLLTEGYIYSKERQGYFVADVKLQFELPDLPEMENRKEPTNDILYNLTRSNPDKDLFPYSVFSKLYRQLMHLPPEQLLTETDAQGLYELRVNLQSYLSQSRGVPCSADQIILGPSTEYLISILLHLLNEKPTVGIEDPGYNGFKQLFKRSNISVDSIPIDDKGVQISALEKSDSDLMIVTSNHQFPTGNIMPLKRRQALLNWANDRENRYIIENDYDSEFKYSGIPIPSLKYLDQNQKVIYLGSFTRNLSPGIRLSYMVLPESLLKEYKDTYRSYSSPLSTSEQWVIRNFLHDGHFTTHLNRSRTFYKKKRDRMIQAIKKLDAEAEVYGENAGLHLLVKPSFAFDGLHFKERALQEGIRLSLLSDYATEKIDGQDNTLFMSFSNIPKEEIEKLIDDIYFLIKKCAI